MAICSKCGSYIAFGLDTCPACGYSRNEVERETGEQKKESESQSAAAAQAAPDSEEAKREKPENRKYESSKTETANEDTGSFKTDKTGEYSSSYSYSYTQGKTSGGYSHWNGKSEYHDKCRNKNPYSSTRRQSYGSAENHGEQGKYDSETEFYADPYDARKNRSMGYLCYIGPLFLITYFTCKDSEFARFHCNQGLLMTLFAVITRALGVFPVLGGVISALGTVMTIVMFFKGISNVSSGKMKELPIIGKIRLIK